MTSTPDMPPPVSPIHGERAAALGFPDGVHVVRLSTTGGTIGAAVSETWAAVTSPGNRLLGWAERAVGGEGWRVVAEAAPGSGQLAAWFDGAASRAGAFRSLAELARLTAAYALAYVPDVDGGPFPGEVVIGGRLYAHRLVSAEQAEAYVNHIAPVRAREGLGAEVAEVMAILREVLAPAAIADLIMRLRAADDGLAYPHVVDGLAEILRRARATAPAEADGGGAEDDEG